MRQVSKENIQCIIIYVKVKNRLNRTSFFRDVHVDIKLQGEKENDCHNSQHTLTTRKQVGSTIHTWEYCFHDYNFVGEDLVEIHPE